MSYYIVILLVSKCLYNFPPHLSHVVTLPENTSETKQARCFPLGGRVAVKWLRMMGPNDYWRICSIPCNFQYWPTCLWCIFMTEYEVTNRWYSHSTHGSCSTAPWMPVNWTGVYKFFSSHCLRLYSFNSYLKLCRQILCSIYLLK